MDQGSRDPSRQATGTMTSRNDDNEDPVDPVDPATPHVIPSNENRPLMHLSDNQLFNRLHHSFRLRQDQASASDDAENDTQQVQPYYYRFHRLNQLIQQFQQLFQRRWNLEVRIQLYIALRGLGRERYSNQDENHDEPTD